jgi:hypothetical protein
MVTTIFACSRPALERGGGRVESLWQSKFLGDGEIADLVVFVRPFNVNRRRDILELTSKRTEIWLVRAQCLQKPRLLILKALPFTVVLTYIQEDRFLTYLS